ncbi:MAG: glycosyltransferase [Terrisporobacter othiniensis]|uniref:glycosyltransferase family 4 protein n=1 Tax=Terrisporobacter othiniensis TaxID=1577792 RepID=UPI0029090B9A|nr:glycosyltransferase [Terrisporobacter othiniensis]MDU6983194.1 glycosyltransferase [Terrisporobacter othiniensis]
MKILEIGPSVNRSKGGIATVISGISESDKLNDIHYIDLFESYIDGNLFKRLIFSIYSYFKIYKVYKNYDLFHIHMASYGSTYRKIYYIKFLKKKRKKVILHIHGAEYLTFYNSLNSRKQKYIMDNLNKSDMIIALSEKWKYEFETQLNMKNVYVLNNGIDTEDFQNAISNCIENKNKFLFLGRLGIRKGAYDLLKAIEELKQEGITVKCYMAGDGEIGKFREIIYKKNLQECIEVIGWIGNNEKIKLLKNVSTVILPSYNEGLPMAILEGMACGKAIISTNVGAIPEVVIENENGIIVEPGNIEQIKNAIKKVISNNENIMNMSKNNIEKIDKIYSRKKMHEILNKYFMSHEEK